MFWFSKKETQGPWCRNETYAGSVAEILRANSEV